LPIHLAANRQADPFRGTRKNLKYSPYDTLDVSSNYNQRCKK
jgi:hypothetical protein